MMYPVEHISYYQKGNIKYQGHEYYQKYTSFEPVKKPYRAKK